MKKSARALRMQRHHKRMAKESKLSLVSLMDIFTILVFFLMVNASDVQVLQNNKSVELPKSTSQKAAKETLILMVNNQDLILQGRKLVDVENVLNQEQDIIPELVTELEYQVNRSTNSTSEISNTEEPVARAITIMGDKSIPYTVLKRIMQTCAEVGFTNISLAVEGEMPDEQQTAPDTAQQESV
ncbi:ExbD/TolR family protein [Paraglaciecola marina]|uniref:ExbD/TolR family protein n=1 Tax=Paraglaciecola marina TaxID=2500157 RepID=UPI00105EF349|nr:biopolymer transporter ExbD [Paraglaciecola marina]